MQAQKLEAAENTWRDIQQAANIDYNPLESITEYEETPRRKAPTKILQQTPAQTTARTPEPQAAPVHRTEMEEVHMRADNFEDALDRMMQAYEKFSAHLINVEQHFDHNQYPIQRFGRACNPPRNELDPKD